MSKLSKKEISELLSQIIHNKKIVIPERSMTILATWHTRLEKAETGENIVYKKLKENGYLIVPFEHICKESISFKAKLEAKENWKVPDALAIKAKNQELIDAFFLDAKFKSVPDYLGWVNQNAYHDYWRLCGSINIDLKIFFYIKSTDQIYAHVCREPQKEPHFKEAISGLNPIYIIPKSELTLYKQESTSLKNLICICDRIKYNFYGR